MGEAADKDASVDWHDGHKVGSLSCVLALNPAYNHRVRLGVDGKEEGSFPVVVAESEDGVAGDGTTAIGIGGDPIIGTSTKEAVELLMNDDETEAIVMIGEIGGQLEADAAKWIKADGNRKPVVGFIAGQTAPAGRTMGHAGAIVGGADDTAQAKMAILRANGIHVVDSPAKIGEMVANVLN